MLIMFFSKFTAIVIEYRVLSAMIDIGENYFYTIIYHIHIIKITYKH